MTNRTKWLVAIPFTAMVALAVPALVAGDWYWVFRGWPELGFTALTGGMWLAATAFVDVGRPRQPADLPRLLITAGLLLAVPVAVLDRAHGRAWSGGDGLSATGVVLCALALVLGLSARRALGSAYAPHPAASPDQPLVRSGPYRWVRHPIYTAALFWAAGWPLILASLWGSGVTLGFLVPAVVLRIRVEEAMLTSTYGPAYVEYQHRTWRLIPFVY